MAINTCNNPSIWEAEVGLPLQMLMPAWATNTVPDQPGLCKILSQKQSVDMVVHSCTSITWEVGTGGSGAPGHTGGKEDHQLHNGLMTSLDYKKPYLCPLPFPPPKRQGIAVHAVILLRPGV